MWAIFGSYLLKNNILLELSFNHLGVLQAEKHIRLHIVEVSIGFSHIQALAEKVKYVFGALFFDVLVGDIVDRQDVVGGLGSRVDERFQVIFKHCFALNVFAENLLHALVVEV